jgi:cytidyltransferase-like protein
MAVRVAVTGRFQPFHWGHFEYLLEATRLGDVLVVGITNPSREATYVSEAGGQRANPVSNPFTYQQRVEMISKSLHRYWPELAVEFRGCDLRSPELLRASLGQCEVVATTIYDEWGEEKAAMISGAGYEVAVLWRRANASKLVTGTEVRRRLLTGTSWEHLVPSGSAAVIRAAVNS